jgi:hypothetical protein
MMELPLPIIQMVFALASKKSAVKHHVLECSRPSPFTSYDIWCTGIFPETFPFINDDNDAPDIRNCWIAPVSVAMNMMQAQNTKCTTLKM